MNNREINEKYFRKTNELQDEDLYNLLSRGCMGIIVMLLVVILAVVIITCLFSGCSKLERQSPVKIVYKQHIESNSQYSVYKVTSYELKETYYDTVTK